MNAKSVISQAMKRITHVHFIGIGGVGMSGIAEVLHRRGYKISGSDIVDSHNTQHLRKLGVQIFINHSAHQIRKANVVVLSNAIAEDNEELLAAYKIGIPVVKRAEMLAELMRFRYGIAVAGAHGKTTTTSMIASIFGAAGLDPTFVIGGKVNEFGGGARLGGDYIIVEADESDSSFLHLQPLVALITNIDADHIASYGGDFQQMIKAYIDFLHNLPFYGLAVICLDDGEVLDIINQIGRPLVTYGFHKNANYRISNFRQRKICTTFEVDFPDGKTKLNLRLRVPGRHNVINAAGAVAVAHNEGIALTAIESGLHKFRGVERRQEIKGCYRFGKGHIMLMDDYGHHPAEIQATINAIRIGWPNRRIVTIFQLHRYTRTRDLYDDFVNVLSSMPDFLFLLKVYSAGEKVIAGANAKSIAHSIRQRGRLDPIVVRDFRHLIESLLPMLLPNDIILTQGAGDISQYAHKLAELCEQKMGVMVV